MGLSPILFDLCGGPATSAQLCCDTRLMAPRETAFFHGGVLDLLLPQYLLSHIRLSVCPILPACLHEILIPA